MKKHLVISITILFLGVAFSSLTQGTIIENVNPPISDGNTLYVGGTGGGNYTTIQDAIDNASDGDTVFVFDKGSPYYENVVVDKSINLIGEDRYSTVIDGNKSGDVVYISADLVKINCFTIRNSSYSDAGVDISSNFNTIKGNIILNNNLAIYLKYSNNNTITNNGLSYNSNNIKLSYASSNSITGNSFSNSYGNTIHLGYSHDNKIKGNRISNNYIHKGIVLENSGNNTITGNTISSNYYECEAGISLFVSDSNIIIGNSVSTSDFFGDGIKLLKSNNNTITGNNVSSNNQDGIHLSFSSNNNITDNSIISNERDGIYLGSSNNNTISGNSFLKDGLRIEDSYHNIVYNNTVNGKPLIYIENKVDKVIDIDAGQVILVSCDNITVNGQELSNTSVGIELLSTNNCFINSNNIFNNRIGIFLSSSSNNTINGNDISSNIYYCMIISHSNNNAIKGNNITSKYFSGISLRHSDYNSLMENSIYAHDWGIYLGFGNYNTISNNTIYARGFMYGFWIDSSSSNIISWNNISCKLGDGLYLESNSNKNIIFRNNIVSNGDNGIHFYGIGGGCENNVISENIINSNGANGILIYKGDNNTVSRNIISSNGEFGILINPYSYYTIIRENNISFNKKYGIWVVGNYYEIYNNNFIKNSRNAFFILHNLFENDNKWAHNYWDRPRILPYPIMGLTVGPFERFPIPWFNIDWRPAKEPYDIGV